ncbi:MAG: hypothetical protein M1355_04445 [Patescibacteria group bacterium]|nr:hypothetical protein [Patescibacteria group bacterium]
MAEKATTTEECKVNTKAQVNNAGAAGGAVYGLGFIGALVYFIQHATSFWNGVLGILKALVWPALLVYQVLGLLKL